MASSGNMLAVRNQQATDDAGKSPPRPTPQSGSEEWECPLCLKLLYEPATASCGHSFCCRCAYDLVYSVSQRSRPGSQAWNDRYQNPLTLKCPLCRASLDRRWTPSPSITLCRLLRQSFPTDYGSRQAEEEKNQLPLPQLPHAPDPESRTRRKVLPLFLLDSMLPGQKMLLHVFEMRYRLLVQNAVTDHGGRFGMMGSSLEDGTAMSDYGTECEIVSCLELPDGRFRLEVEGRSTFKIIDSNLRDGYWEATVENIDPHSAVGDDDENRGGQDGEDTDGAEVRILAERVTQVFDEWESHVRENGWERHPSHFDNVKILLGAKPSVNQPGRLALWTAAAINPLPALGVAKEIRLEVLSAASDRERLKIVSDALDDSITLVAKRRGVVEICGVNMDIQIIWFGVLGVIVVSLVRSYCLKLFERFGLNSALLEVFSLYFDRKSEEV